MIKENLNKIELPPGVRLVAVSKFHPSEAILEAYECGQRVFGESRPQELEAKAAQLPGDIEWHFIGHLQTNKLKKVLGCVSLVHSVDSEHLLEAIERWGQDNGKVTDILLEVHISSDESKQGFTPEEAERILQEAERYPHVRFCGLMGMASLTSDEDVIRREFASLSALKASILERCGNSLKDFKELSMGMSSDWKIAVEEGATMVRIGSSIFGERG